jgi:ATP-dependent Lon protease
LALPWNQKTEDRLHLKDVKEVLDDDHYGLEDIKDRILEYLAVKKLNQNAKSPILCFLGPPGVGKTSLGRSIARAMSREFCRISLGGVKDEADIRGHRKTYVGAYPGRIMQAIKTSGTTNPIVMLDEIDKLTSDHRGDPSSALLEVLDPEQNKNFVDHYLGIEFDLSDVMFIANANSLQTIPAPLLDRMEIIEISGYSEKEKSIIAKQYLIPRQLNDKGLDNHDVQFTNEAILEIIRSYTKESGLRGFEKQIAAVCRKIARRVAETTSLESEKPEKLKLKVQPKDIHQFLGTQKYIQEFYHREPVAGVSLGLAYTSVGGEVLAIEVNVVKSGESRLVMTGRLGDVMKESAKTAWGFIKANCESFGIMPERLKQLDLHIHVPAGGVPKDGPSAGIAICSAILSALLGTPPAETTAMTGEITLLGKVLPIGGVKEKVLAAVRAKLSSVILPEANRPNWNELDDHIKGQISARFVGDYVEVFEELFEDVPARVIKPAARSRAKIAS